MARTEITVNTLGRSTSGTTISDVVIPADGIKFKNDGKTFLLLRNTHSSTNEATIVTGATLDGLAVSDLAITMAAGDSTNQVILKGPFPTTVYNQTDGYVHVDAGTADEIYAYAFKSA